MVSEPWASTPPSRCWSRPRRTRPWSCGTSRRLCRPRSRRPSTWSRSIHSEPTPAPSCRWPSHPPVTSAFRGALIAPYGYGICPTPAWTLTIASVSTYLNPIMPGGGREIGVAPSGDLCFSGDIDSTIRVWNMPNPSVDPYDCFGKRPKCKKTKSGLWNAPGDYRYRVSGGLARIGD